MAAMINFKSFGRGALFALVAASATVATTSSYAVPGYDGLWSVSIITEKGACAGQGRDHQAVPVRQNLVVPARPCSMTARCQ